MGIINAFLTFIMGLVYMVVDIIKYILNFFLSILDMVS